MKINAVCKKTGLSERTVRYYVEKGLLNPKFQIVNGRTTIEYSEYDIELLKDISKLRKAEFSIPDIISMQNSSNAVSKILLKHCQTLETELIQKEELIQKLKKASERENISWRKLASILFQAPNCYEKICMPLDDFEATDYESVPTKTTLKSIIKVSIILALLSIVIFIFINQRHNNKILSTEIVIVDKWRENDKQYISIYSAYPDSEPEIYFKSPQTIQVDSSHYFDAFKINSEPYTSFHIWIEIPYSDAKQLELLDYDKHLLRNKVLENPELIKKYSTVKRIDNN